jgi:hypothetical protein
MDLSLSEAREYDRCARNERRFLARLRACIVKEKRDDKRAVPLASWSRAGFRAQLLASWARAVVATEKAQRAWAMADHSEKAGPPSPACHDATPEGRPLAPDGFQPTGASVESRHPDLNRGPTVYELAGNTDADIPGTNPLDSDVPAPALGTSCSCLGCAARRRGEPPPSGSWSTGRPR